MEKQKKQLITQLCTMENQITESELLKELYIILRSELVAHIEKDGNYITIKFLNGQNFRVSVRKV